MPYITTVALAAALIATLAGCGQMGPLYMPTEEAAQEAPAPAAETATQQSGES